MSARDHAPPRRMAAFFRKLLVFQLHRRGAGLIIAAHSVRDVQQAAVAGVGVGDQRRTSRSAASCSRARPCPYRSRARVGQAQDTTPPRRSRSCRVPNPKVSAKRGEIMSYTPGATTRPACRRRWARETRERRGSIHQRMLKEASDSVAHAEHFTARSQTQRIRLVASRLTSASSQRLLETYQVVGEAAWQLPVQRMAHAGVDRTGGPWQLPLQPLLIRLGREGIGVTPGNSTGASMVCSSVLKSSSSSAAKAPRQVVAGVRRHSSTIVSSNPAATGPATVSRWKDSASRAAPARQSQHLVLDEIHEPRLVGETREAAGGDDAAHPAGWSIAIRRALTAPIEWPTTSTGGISSVVTRAAASSAKSRVR